MDSTLRTNFTQLQSNLGHWLGFGRGALYSEPAWDAYTQRSLDQYTEMGTARVYQAYKYWSFLCPVASLTLLSGTSTLELPLDWSGHNGDCLCVPTTGNSRQRVLYFTNSGAVRAAAAAYPSMTGIPEMMCEEPLRGTVIDSPQKNQLRWYPLADQNYTCQVAYYLVPAATEGKLPYLYGGAELSNLFLLSCMEMAGVLAYGTVGNVGMSYQKELATQIQNDQRHKPTDLGLNTTWERYSERGKPVRQYANGGVSWNGVRPG